MSTNNRNERSHLPASPTATNATPRTIPTPPPYSASDLPPYTTSAPRPQNKSNPPPTRVEYVEFPPSLVHSSRNFVYRAYPGNDIESALNTETTSLHRSLEIYRSHRTSAARISRRRILIPNLRSKERSRDCLAGSLLCGLVFLLGISVIFTIFLVANEALSGVANRGTHLAESAV